MTALALASFLAFGALLVLYGANSTELIASLDLGYADLGLIGSTLSLGLGVGIIAAGPIVDRFPRKPLFMAACAVVIGATTTLGPHSTFDLLLAQTLLIGLGAGFYETVLNALAIEQFGARAPRRLLLLHSGATLAATATPLVFEALRSLFDIAWYDTFRLVGAAHALLIGAACFVDLPRRRAFEPSPSLTPPLPVAAAAAERGPAGAPDGRGRDVPGAAPARVPISRSTRGDWTGLAAICVATFAYVGVESALTIFVADHATKDLGLDATRAAATISAFWGGLLGGRIFIGLSPRPPGAGTTALLAAIAAAIVIAFGSGVLTTPEWAMAATGFFLGGVFPVMIGLAGMTLPTAAGTAVGLAGGLGSLGGFVIPWLTGYVAGTGGLPFALATLGGWILLLVLAAAFARLRRPGMRTPAIAEA